MSDYLPAASAEEVYNFPSLEWRFNPVFLVAPVYMRLPDDLFAELTAHVDAELARPDRRPYGHQLAGRIDLGEQVGAAGTLTDKFKALFCELGRQYVFNLAQPNEQRLNPDLRVSFLDSWIVKSLAGDYNPAHKHAGQVSGIVYIRVPPPVADPATTDGKLAFLFGQLQEANLDLLGDRRVVPAPGDVYLFPSWLTHVVYPFRGPGVRVSYSFNLEVSNIARII